MMRAALEKFRESISDKSREDLIEIAVAQYSGWESCIGELREFKEMHTGVVRDYKKLREEYEKVRAERDELFHQNIHLTEITTKQTNSLFGRSSEKTEDLLCRNTHDEQDMEDPVDEDAPECIRGPETSADPDSLTEIEVRKMLKELLGEKKKKKKEKGKRETNLEKLPVQETYLFDVEALDKLYGNDWRIARWVKRRTVEHVRSGNYLQITYIPMIETAAPGIQSPFWTEPLIEKSLVSSSLMASILYDKYAMFLPHYRQEHDPERFGFPISRQTICNWEEHICSEFLKPVYDHLRILMKGFYYQHCDETPWMVIRDGRRPGAKGYFWVHLSGELLDGYKVMYISFELTRAADHLKEFFEGIDHPVFLTDDAYAGYYTAQKEYPEQLTICGCLTHARRRFANAVRLMRSPKDLTLEEMKQFPEYRCILMIAEIYMKDEQLKSLSADERLKERQEHVKPLFDEFIQYLETIDVNDPGTSETLKDAIGYTLNHEQELRQFLNDGNIPIDNGSCERRIRNIARLRVNSLFSCTKHGAETSAVIMSLIQTADLNGADPYYYLKYLMEELPKHLTEEPAEYMDDMMPWAQQYLEYEPRERERLIKYMLPPPGNEKPDIRKLRKASRGVA